VTWTNGYSNLFCNLSDSQQMISLDVFHMDNQRFGSWSWRSVRMLIVIRWSSSIFKTCEAYVGHHLTRGILTAHLIQHMGFWNCFPYLEQNLTQILRSFSNSTKHDKTATCSITKLVIKTKWNIWSTWNKMACVTVSYKATQITPNMMDALLIRTTKITNTN
jgi:hypothetical protein